MPSGLRVTFLRAAEGCCADASDVGRPVSLLGGGSTVNVHVWASTEGLVVAPASMLGRRRQKRISPGKNLTPDDIASAYRRPMFLEPDGLDRIEIGKGREHRNVLGVHHAIFDYADGTEFDLMVRKGRTAGTCWPCYEEGDPGRFSTPAGTSDDSPRPLRR